MRVVGTAGHVDHGKSTLVQALTGINPDRLKEEQARQMTIDLGFAWMTLPSGQVVSLVDVPGHEAFIKNMLAGVGSIDAALLVVAADEGIMPQTREHLAILNLLQVKGGLVALTKSDLATEPGWLDLVEAEVRKSLESTVLASVPIVRVSAKTGQGLDVLRRELDRALEQVTEKKDRGRPRLPVDRVFSLAGFGTVVTGSLGDGSLAVGDEVEIAPRGLRSRIRGLQTHKQKITRAAPGGRVAVNLGGVATDQLARGDFIIHAGTYVPTAMIDARIEWLATAPKPLVHNQQLQLFAFASEVLARVRLLAADRLSPGQAGWVQLILDEPIILAAGDRFILRYPSPSVTVGGGLVVDAHSSARHRRNRPEVLERLERASRGTPAELAIQLIDARGPLEWREMAHELGVNETTGLETLQALLHAGDLIRLDHGPALARAMLLGRNSWRRWSSQMADLLENYHRQFPLRAGMPREEFKSRLSTLPARAFDLALERARAEEIIDYNEKVVARRGHHVEFDAALEARVNALLAAFARAPYSPPSPEEAESALGREALNALIDQGRLLRISAHVLLTPEAERAMMDWIVNVIRQRGQVTAAELRDQFDTSRKYAVAFLEYLDQKRVTRRVADARILR